MHPQEVESTTCWGRPALAEVVIAELGIFSMGSSEPILQEPLATKSGTVDVHLGHNKQINVILYYSLGAFKGVFLQLLQDG